MFLLPRPPTPPAGFSQPARPAPLRATQSSRRAGGRRRASAERRRGERGPGQLGRSSAAAAWRAEDYGGGGDKDEGRSPSSLRAAPLRAAGRPSGVPARERDRRSDGDWRLGGGGPGTLAGPGRAGLGERWRWRWRPRPDCVAAGCRVFHHPGGHEASPREGSGRRIGGRGRPRRLPLPPTPHQPHL